MGWKVFQSFLLWIFVNEFYICTAICPHEEKLEKWSDENTWVNGKPGKNDNVTITKSILFDESPPELFSITIEDGGRLVWSPSKNIDLRIHYILVKGTMEIGSESEGCKYTAKATITLIGERGEYSVPGFAEKFIGVAENGTLELHGQYKLSWTKLTKTVNKLDEEHGLIFRHQDQEGIRRAVSGIQVLVFNATTLKVDFSGIFQMSFKSRSSFENNVRKMISFLQDIPDGKVIAMAAQHNIVKYDLGQLIDAFEKLAYGSVTKKSYLRKIKAKDAWAMILIKGDSSKTRETLTKKRSSQVGQMANVQLIMLEKKRKIDVFSYMHNKISGHSYVDFMVTNTDFSMPILDVVDDVTTWKEDDTVLLTSTDYDWNQAEKARVVNCNGLFKPNQVRVQIMAKYTHFGEIYKNVDMRGEVALLSRNILIQGETTDKKKFGGHTKYLKGFKNVHIEGVELTNMGQQKDLGRYPVHFHICEDVDNYDNPPYIRQNSIHHTHARCTTIHATHGVKLSDNVCFDTMGHGYFLEDGGEKRTVFEGNLGAGQRSANLIPADKKATTFWITNPQTYLRNNVAAGGDGNGFWFTYPDIPVGPSANKTYMQEKEARHTAIYEFFNNVAHSNRHSGLFIDNILKPNNVASGYNRYEPWQNPLDKKSGPKAVNLTRFTGYKNRVHNTWIRGGLFKLKQFSLSDSKEGVQFLRENKQEQYFTDSVIIGDSVNIGEPAQYTHENGSKLTFHRSLPLPGIRSTPRQGIRFFSGPVYVSNTWFGGFKNTELYWAGAIGLRDTVSGFSTALSSVSGAAFGFDDPDGGNRVRGHAEILSGMGDDYIATFRDVDGSVTSVPGSQIVPRHPFFLTPSCVTRENWNMSYCPYYYGLLFVRGNKNEDIFVLRDDNPKAVDVSRDGVDKNSVFLVMLDDKYSYTVFWKTSVPKVFILTGVGVTRSNAILVGVCVPRNATFNLQGFQFPTVASQIHMWTRVDTLKDVDSDEKGPKYFYDSDVGILYVKLRHKDERTSNDKGDCPGSVCARVIVRIKSGDLKDIDCTKRAFPNNKRVMPAESRLRLRRSAVLSATAVDPPAGWGAGSTKPFPAHNDISNHDI